MAFQGEAGFQEWVIKDPFPWGVDWISFLELLGPCLGALSAAILGVFNDPCD